MPQSRLFRRLNGTYLETRSLFNKEKLLVAGCYGRERSCVGRQDRTPTVSDMSSFNADLQPHTKKDLGASKILDRTCHTITPA